MYMNWQTVYMSVRHKHLKIDQRKLDRAKKLLGVATERETIDRALDTVLADAAIVAAHTKVRKVGGLADALGSSR